VIEALESSAIVIAEDKDPQQSSVPATVEQLIVVANMFLFIIPCASLDYTANQFRGQDKSTSFNWEAFTTVKLWNFSQRPEVGSLKLLKWPFFL
jgi:hypothetical protein